jgi:hypothetical protein
MILWYNKYMHKHIGYILLIGLALVLFLVPGLVDRLFVFFFIGLVPYTSYTLPPVFMFALYSLLLAIGVYVGMRQLSAVTNQAKRDLAARERARKKVLKNSSPTTPTQSSHHPKKHYQPAVEN